MIRMSRICPTLLLALLLVSVLSHAETLRVPETHPTIQSAVDAAGPGDVVEVSRGLYCENLVIEKGIEITGAGATETFVRGEHGAPVVDISAGTVLLQGLCIERAGEQAPGARWDFTGQEYSDNAGVLVKNASFSLLRNCVVQSNSYGVLVVDHARLVMSRCTISANWDGVRACENSDILLRKCTIDQSLRCGICLHDRARAVISACALAANRVIGIQVSSHATAALDATTVRGPGKFGVWTSGSSRTDLEDCTVGEPSMPFAIAALRAAGAATMEVRASAIRTVGETGILVEELAELKAHDTTVQGSSKDAIKAIGESQLQMMECTVCESDEAGIRLEGRASARLSWSMLNNNDYGVRLYGESSLSAVGCSFENNDAHVDLNESSSAAMHQCNLTGGDFGIESYDSSRVAATDCLVEECKNNGLVIMDSATASIDTCRFRENGCGIVIEGSSSLTLLRSEIRENEYGLYLWEAGCCVEEEAHFSGAVSGRGNIIRSNGSDTCPMLDAPWPEDFFDARVLMVPSEYATIQEAVDTAFPGDTVRLAEGEYDERVSIDKPITLEGAGAATTVVHKRYVHYSDIDYPPALEVVLDAGMVVLRDFAVLDCGLGVSATLACEAALKVENVRITRLGDCRSRGFTLRGAGSVDLAECCFHGLEYAIVATDVTLHLADCSFGALWKHSAMGLEARGGTHVKCLKNVFFGQSYGFFAHPSFVGMATGTSNLVDAGSYAVWPVPEIQDSPWPAQMIVSEYAEEVLNLWRVIAEAQYVLFADEDYLAASELLNVVLEEVREWPNPLLEARASFLLALAYERLGKRAYAASLYMEATRFAESFGHSIYEVSLLDETLGEWLGVPGARISGIRGEFVALVGALARYILAQDYNEDEAHEKAIESLSEALESLAGASESGAFHEDLQWLSLFELGKAYEGLGSYDAAVGAYLESISIIEQVRANISSEELKVFWHERTSQVYEHLVDLLYEMGEGSSAFMYAERCRARLFLDLLAEGPVEALANIAEEGISTGVVEASVIESDLAEVVAKLPEDTTALEYFVSDNAIYLWVVRDGVVRTPIQISCSREALMDQVIACRQALESGDPAANFHLAILYDWLIAPAEDLLPASDGEDIVPHLVIVPSGPLYYLPFQALLRVSEDRAERQRLIERYSISYTPSLVTLKYAQQQGSPLAEVSFLALADPNSGDPAIGRLPEAQTESRRIASLFSLSEVFVDTAATESVVQARASVVTDVLFSTHGLFNPHNPMFSYLLLSPDEGSDGRLYTYEVFGLPLSANLVVLSACETLLPSMEDMEGQIRAIRAAPEDEEIELTNEQLETLTMGDEISGLTRAFLYAGTPSVLSSLWSVYSQA
ncbi:MAG: CHAT domain-containing protein, partial [Candidatus Atribacteria bacterium]